MPIELLFILPIVASAIIVLVIILSVQKGGDGSSDRLEMGVKNFNAGRTDTRHNTMEQTISLVSTALSNQQKIIENLSGKDSGTINELTELKRRLVELQNEYDILLSENYTLKSQMNNASMYGNNEAKGIGAVTKSKGRSTRAHSMLDDTRTIAARKQLPLDDTSEIDISGL